jgi:ribosome maturation protein SDO1
VLPLLQQQFPIERAKMRLKLQVPVAAQQQLLDMLDAKGSLVETVDSSASTTTVITQVG